MTQQPGMRRIEDLLAGAASELKKKIQAVQGEVLKCEEQLRSARENQSVQVAATNLELLKSSLSQTLDGHSKRLRFLESVSLRDTALTGKDGHADRLLLRTATEAHIECVFLEDFPGTLRASLDDVELYLGPRDKFFDYYWRRNGQVIQSFGTHDQITSEYVVLGEGSLIAG